MAEQPHVVGSVPVDEEVADDVAVAVEPGGEGSGRGADGFPAVAGGPGHVDRAGGVAGCLVEVQVRRQLVALAGGGAAHAHPGAGEGGGVVAGVGGGRRAVAVRVPAHRVQLLQVGHLDQVVAVGVVVGVVEGDLDVAHGAAGNAGGVAAGEGAVAQGHRQVVHTGGAAVGAGGAGQREGQHGVAGALGAELEARRHVAAGDGRDEGQHVCVEGVAGQGGGDLARPPSRRWPPPR